MSEKKKNLSFYDKEEMPNGKEMKLGIVVSDWNPEITSSLLQACFDTLIKHEVPADQIKVIHVPGTYELSSGANLLFNHVSYDGVVCLGCVIKGETRHDEYINHAVAQGLTMLSFKVNKPVIFGVLTTENMQQAKNRAGGDHGNKGTEAAITLLKMVELHRNIDEGKKQIGF